MTTTTKTSPTPFPLRSDSPRYFPIEVNPFKLFAPHCLDSYKLGHRAQYTKGTEYVLSNFTARNLKYLNLPKKYDEGIVVWAGIQGTTRELVNLWEETFFSQPKEEVIAKFAARTPAFASDDKVPYTAHLEALHDLQYLPIRIKSLKEGSKVNIGIPLYTIVNTLPDFYWLTNALETWLSNESWKFPTVATIAYTYRKILEDFAEQTGSPKEFVDWQGHCFADRGMSGMADAAKNCAAHLISFKGSDSVSSFDWLDYYYKGAETFLGGSVNATEHSVMCLDGQDNELETIRRIIGEVHDTGIVSFVADSWDFWKVVTEYMPALKETILGRKFNSIGLSKTTVRPDSGNPADIICGKPIKDFSNCKDLEAAKAWAADYFTGVETDATEFGRKGQDSISEKFKYKEEYYGILINIHWGNQDRDYYCMVAYDVVSCEPCELSPEDKGAIQCLWETFGGTETDKGFKVLSDRVGLIYGDSITLDRCIDILQRLKDKGFASCNVVLGIGLK